MSYYPAKKNTAYIFYAGLVSRSTGQFQTSPTLAAGDFKVSIDGGTLNNLATLPTVTPASSKMVKISLSAAEMNGDNITIVGSDAAGAEWDDIIVNIQTSVRQLDDLAFPMVSGRGINVEVTSGFVVADTQSWAGQSIPSPAVTGIPKVDVSYINGGATNGNNAVLSLKQLNIANNAGTAMEVQSTGGDGTGMHIQGNGAGYGVDIGGGSTGKGASISAGLSGGDGLYVKSFASDGVSIHGAAGFSGMYVAGDLGFEVQNITLDDEGSTLDLASIADKVWDEQISGHLITGSTGKALNSASASGDPWETSLPGVYGAGTAGKIIGDNLDATVSSRSSHSAADVWAVGSRTLTSFGTLVADIWANAVRTITGGTISTVSDKTGYSLTADYDPAKTAAQASDIPSADITAIKTQTDKLQFDASNNVQATVPGETMELP